MEIDTRKLAELSVEVIQALRRESAVASRIASRRAYLSKRHGDGETLHFRKVDKELLGCALRTNRALTKAACAIIGVAYSNQVLLDPPGMIIDVMDRIRERALMRIRGEI